MTSSKTTIEYTHVCFSNDVVFNLTLDRYGSETTWTIKNSSGVTVRSGGPYTDASTNIVQVLAPMNFNLPDGTYTFTINDAYGDGMVTSSSVVGSYTMYKDCGALLFSGNGDFTSSRSHTFSIP